MVFHSDGIDTVRWRQSRIRMFTPQELDPEIVIVTTCQGLTQTNPLFRGIPNRVHTVKSVQAAMTWVFAEINQQDDLAGKEAADE